MTFWGMGVFIKFFEELYKIVIKEYLAEPEGRGSCAPMAHGRVLRTHVGGTVGTAKRPLPTDKN